MVFLIFTSARDFLPTDDHETMSEVAYPSRHSRFTKPGRSSARAMVPLHRLDTLKEAPSVDVLNESRGESSSAGRGMPRPTFSSSDPRVPAPRRQLSPTADNDNNRNLHQEAAQRDEEEEQQPSRPPPAWAAEPRDNTPRNPLLRRPQWNPKK